MQTVRRGPNSEEYSEGKVGFEINGNGTTFSLCTVSFFKRAGQDTYCRPGKNKTPNFEVPECLDSNTVKYFYAWC